VLIAVVLRLFPFPEIIRQSSQIIQTSINGKTTQTDSIMVLLNFQPWRNDLWERLGREHLDAGKYADAIVAFEKSDEFGGLSTDGSIGWADALILNGEREAGKSFLRNLSVSQADLFDLMQIIALQRQISDVYGAETTLLTAHRIDPDNDDINFQLGLMLSTTQPDSASQFLMSTNALSANDQLLKEALLTTIETSSGLESASERYLRIGQVLSTFNEWDVASQAFQSALANDPQSALSWIYLAEAQQQLGINSFEAISRALELDPDNEIVNGLTGLYYRRKDKNELALIYLNKAGTINPDASVWVIEKSRTYEAMGNLETAYKLLINAINLSPEDWSTWKALAVFSFSHNYEVEQTGLVAARKALVLNPSSSALTDLLGTGLMLAGDYDSAERFFLQADTMDPHQSAILIHLGQLKTLQKDFIQARNYLTQAIEYAPNNRLRELAIQLLNENSGK